MGGKKGLWCLSASRGIGEPPGTLACPCQWHWEKCCCAGHRAQEGGRQRVPGRGPLSCHTQAAGARWQLPSALSVAGLLCEQRLVLSGLWDLWRSSGPAPLLEQAHSEQAAQDSSSTDSYRSAKRDFFQSRTSIFLHPSYLPVS